jgi:hypothetical protein
MFGFHLSDVLEIPKRLMLYHYIRHYANNTMYYHYYKKGMIIYNWKENNCLEATKTTKHLSNGYYTQVS